MAAHDWAELLSRVEGNTNMPAGPRRKLIEMLKDKVNGKKGGLAELFILWDEIVGPKALEADRAKFGLVKKTAAAVKPISVVEPVEKPKVVEVAKPHAPPLPVAVPASSKMQRTEKARRRASFVVEKPKARLLNELSPGQTVTVNNIVYKIQSVIGAGGSCIVYKATTDAYEKPVALKIVSLTPSDNSRQTFINEVKFLEKLQESNHVIKMHDSQATNDRIYVVMELGDKTLKHFLDERKQVNRMDPATTRWIWSEMLQCVRVIHEKHIVHADLKPANFVIVDSALKLIDFGIAAQMSADVEVIHRKSLQGTLNYISPEAVDECPESRDFQMPLNSDVWSLGCILYALVTGAPPFNHIINQDMKINAIRSAPINFPELADSALSDVLHKCLDRNWKARPTVDELLEHPYLNHTHSLNLSVASELVDEVYNLTPQSGARKLQEAFQNAMTTTQRRRANR